jgi:hypothetical protein
MEYDNRYTEYIKRLGLLTFITLVIRVYLKQQEGACLPQEGSFQHPEACRSTTKNLQLERYKLISLDRSTRSDPKSMGGLAFWHIHAFNIAMLSLQVWRLLRNPDSLCVRVLQAKYYSNGNIIDAQPTEGISYAWQSLLRGVKLIRGGYICSTGDGTLVNMERSLYTAGLVMYDLR